MGCTNQQHVIKAMTELEKYIQGYFGVTNEDLAAISSFFEPLSIKKGDFFLKPGWPCERLGFLHAGIMREFLPVGEKEVTKWILTAGSFATDLPGFMFNVAARFNLQALTDCELYVINAGSYRKIPHSVPRWQELEKLFITKCFAVLEERVITHLAMDAEERYLRLFSSNSQLFNVVPLQYLASMLGMTPETLSRLRKKSL